MQAMDHNDNRCNNSILSFLINSNCMRLTILPLLLLFLLSFQVSSQTSVLVSTTTKKINTLATYTFVLTFDTSAIRTTLTINLPSALSTTNTTTVAVGGNTLNSSQYTLSTNSVSITRSMTNTSVVMTNIMNPSSAITTIDFTIATNVATDSQPASIYNYLAYQFNSLQSCRYSFTGTTEQVNSTLTTTLLLNDPIPLGSNRITIGYPINWQHLPTKSLTWGSPSITCSYALNASASFTTLPCSYTSTTITATLNLISTAIPLNTTLSIKIAGVNCPPTVTTPTISNYSISVFGASGAIINQLSSCNISDTTVSSATGAFTNSGLFINSVYTNPTVNYTATVPVTFQPADTLEITFEVSTTTCSGKLFLSRSTPLEWTSTNTVGNTRFYSLTSATSNDLSSSTLVLYPDCSFNTPPSATPSPFTFLFKRNSQLYLNLTASFTALAQPFASSSNFILTRQTTSAVSPSSYTFALNTSQPLSKQAQITFILPSQIRNNTFGGTSSCTATIATAGTVVSSCSLTSNGSSYLSVAFNHTGLISAGSRIVVTVFGLANPSYAYTSYPLGVSTYYNSSLSSSLVEYNNSISSVVYTTHTTYQLAISPSTFQVYQTASLNLSYTNEVFLQTGTTFSWTFPAAITTLTFGSVIYKAGSIKSINQSTLTTAAPFTLTVTLYQSVTVGTTLLFPVTLRTPSNLGTYGPINFRAILSPYTYQTSSFLELAVTQTSNVNVGISVPSSSPLGQYTGRPTLLTFTIVSYMPHSTPNFSLLISFPSDTSLVPSGTCSGHCLSSIRLYNSTTANITINNNITWTGSIYTYVVTFGTFTTPRHIGQSLTWNFLTYNNDGSQVGTGTAVFNTQLPSPITGSLSKNYRYYRSNTQPVEMHLTLTNGLTTGDYLLLQFGPDTYSSSTTVACPQTLATCSISTKSTSNILIVKAVPNINQLNTQSMTLQLSGLTSSSTSLYVDIAYFNVSSYTSADLMVDSGSLTYNVSCTAFPSYNCKECYSNGSCISCYTSEGMNLLNNRCVTNCTTESQYFSFNSSGTCLNCVSPCQTCFNSTHCRTCISGYYLKQDSTCSTTCETTAGFFISTVNSISYCLACYDSQCLVCTSSATNACTSCLTGFLQQGICVSGCTLANTYQSSAGSCLTCNAACNGCSTAGNGNCAKCNFNYYNSSGYCVSTCPTGTAIIQSTQSCGCSGQCITCVNSSTYCLSCLNDSLANTPRLAYFGNCIFTCPLYSYLSGVECLPCTSGCFNCTASTCFSCESSRYMHENLCYQDCNTVGMQYDGTTSSSGSKICVLCPNGCDSCSNNTCTSCLSGYSLQISTCVEVCIVLGNCSSAVPDRVLPMPGLILVGAWAVIVVVVKLITKKLYLPFSLMFVFCLAQLGLLFGSVIVLGNSQTSSSSTTISRLLVGLDYSYRSTILILFVVALVVNYLSNFLYLFLFCKYLWPLLPNPKQVDYITNGLVLVMATASNYRFGFIAFSKMFPKPQIPIDNSSRLTPINYLATVTLVLDAIPLTGAAILVYKETAKTDLFMLGIDILIVLAILLIVSIWMVAVPKADDFYTEQVKKTKMEEVYHEQFRTQDDLNNNDKNVSYSKLVGQGVSFDKVANQTIIHDQIISNSNKEHGGFVAVQGKARNSAQFVMHSEEENPPLLNQHHTTRKNNPTAALKDQSEDLQQVIDFEKNSLDSDDLERHSDGGSYPLQAKKTKRSQYSPKDKNKKETRKNKNPNNEDDALNRKARETAVNFSKSKPNKPKEPFNYSGSEIIHVKEAKLEEDKQIEQILGGGMDQALSKTNNNKHATERGQVKKKHRPNRRGDRHSQQKIFLKKQPAFESNPSDGNSFKGEQIDLDEIIESKVRQSKRVQARLPQSQRKRDPREDISPSWFNTQNQRFDISEIE